MVCGDHRREVDVEKEKRAFGVLSDEASSLKATVSGCVRSEGLGLTGFRVDEAALRVW